MSQQPTVVNDTVVFAIQGVEAREQEQVHTSRDWRVEEQGFFLGEYVKNQQG